MLPTSFICFSQKAKIIDGVAMAAEIKDEIKREVEVMVQNGSRPPHLTVLIVGEDPASLTYVKNKIKATQYTGDALHYNL